MDDIITLLGLSAAMLVGCYLAGIIPLTVTLSEVNILEISPQLFQFVDFDVAFVEPVCI